MCREYGRTPTRHKHVPREGIIPGTAIWADRDFVCPAVLRPEGVRPPIFMTGGRYLLLSLSLLFAARSTCVCGERGALLALGGHYIFLSQRPLPLLGIALHTRANTCVCVHDVVVVSVYVAVVVATVGGVQFNAPSFYARTRNLTAPANCHEMYSPPSAKERGALRGDLTPNLCTTKGG